jgi:hypothetical protein
MYSVFVNGRKDERGDYVGGELLAQFKSERKAFIAAHNYMFEHPSVFAYMRRAGEDVFTIVKVENYYHIVDKATQSSCYGVAEDLKGAEEHKAWCEKYHYLGWYH